jgi:hypothetical protein
MVKCMICMYGKKKKKKGGGGGGERNGKNKVSQKKNDILCILY